MSRSILITIATRGLACIWGIEDIVANIVTIESAKDFEQQMHVEI